jgi:hypothetical protein
MSEEKKRKNNMGMNFRIIQAVSISLLLVCYPISGMVVPSEPLEIDSKVQVQGGGGPSVSGVIVGFICFGISVSMMVDKSESNDDWGICLTCISIIVFFWGLDGLCEGLGDIFNPFNIFLWY